MVRNIPYFSRTFPVLAYFVYPMPCQSPGEKNFFSKSVDKGGEFRLRCNHSINHNNQRGNKMNTATLNSPNAKNNITGRALFYSDETRTTVQVGGLKSTDDKVFAGILTAEYRNQSAEEVQNGQQVKIETYPTCDVFVDGAFSVDDKIWASLEDGRLVTNNKPTFAFSKKHRRTSFKVYEVLSENEKEDGCPNAVIGYNFDKD